MKAIAKMIVIYGVLVFLVVEFFNFLFKLALFLLSLLANLLSAAGNRIWTPLNATGVTLSMAIRLIAYAAMLWLLWLLIVKASAIVALVGGAAGSGGGAAGAGAGGVAGFATKMGTLTSKLGMSGIRGAGIQKGALGRGIKALGNLSGGDLRKAGMASNLLGAKKIGKGLNRAGLAKQGFEALSGAKAARNKGKVAAGAGAAKKGDETKDADKAAGAAKNAQEEARNKDKAKDKDKDKDKGTPAGAEGEKGSEKGKKAAAAAGAAAGGRGIPINQEEIDKAKREGRTPPAPIFEDGEVDSSGKTEEERVAEGVRDSNNLDTTADGKKVPGAESRDKDLNVNRTHNEVKNATLNGTNSPMEPSSRTSSTDKNVEVGTDKDRLPVDAEVADAHARKTGENLKDVADSAPGQPVSEGDGEKNSELRDKLVNRNSEGQAVSSFAEDDVMRSGEVLASSAAMHGTVVPRTVTEGGDFSPENIEAETAEAHAQYLTGATPMARAEGAATLAAQVARSGQDPMTIISDAPNPDDMTQGGYPTGTAQAALFAAATASGSSDTFMQDLQQQMAENQAQQAAHAAQAASPESINAQLDAAGMGGGTFSDGTPIPPEPVPEPVPVQSARPTTFSDGVPLPPEPAPDYAAPDPGAAPMPGPTTFSDGTPLPPEPAPDYAPPDPSDRSSYTGGGDAAERVVRHEHHHEHEHHHFSEMASGMFGAGSMGMGIMDRGDAIAAALGASLGALMSQRGLDPLPAVDPIPQQTMQHIDRAVETGSPRDRAIARGSFMDEVGKVAPDAPQDIKDEMEAKFDEALAEAERRAIAEAEERERNRQSSNPVNRGKRRR